MLNFRIVPRVRVHYDIKLILLLIYVIIAIMVISAISLYDSDKANYIKYKKYEAVIDTKQKTVLANAKKYMDEFDNKRISKKKLAANMKQTSEELEKLYNSFKWEKGDETIKELYIIRKQILIDYVQLYDVHAKAILDDMEFDELDDTTFINSLIERYNSKDKYLKAKYD